MNESSEQSPNSLGLVGLDHVTLVVANVGDSRTFYVDQLGFKEVPRPAFEFPGAWFQLGQTMVHVTKSDESSGEAGWAERNVARVSRGHHIAYRTANFEQALRAIQSCGMEIASGPQVRPDGASQVYVYDPDRHLIEICS